MCGKAVCAVVCNDCSKAFCYHHLNSHRQELDERLDEIEVNRDLFRQIVTEQTFDS